MDTEMNEVMQRRGLDLSFRTNGTQVTCCAEMPTQWEEKMSYEDNYCFKTYDWMAFLNKHRKSLGQQQTQFQVFMFSNETQNIALYNFDILYGMNPTPMSET